MTVALPRLREDGLTLSALVTQAAGRLGIDPAFIEKDFWVTEVLRAVACGYQVEDRNGRLEDIEVVFKGGTSLSKVFGIIERFSEDVDILLVMPDASVGKKDKALKGIAAQVQQHLGVDDEFVSTSESTKGIKRNIRYTYPRQFASAEAKEHVLLEMGSRGGPDPHDRHSVCSVVATYAMAELGEPGDRWEEFAPVDIMVLNPERTLVEKLALLHTLATRIDEGDLDGTATASMSEAGRHYYDVDRLLRTSSVRDALDARGTAGIALLADDIHRRSEEAGWVSRPRPSGGYATSSAFADSSECIATARASYTTALGMVHGAKPDFGECLATVAGASSLV